MLFVKLRCEPHPQINNGLIYGLFGLWGEGGGVEASSVELAKNILILG